MSQYEVKLTDSAAKDILAISDFYQSNPNSELISDMLQKITQGLKTLASHSVDRAVVPEMASIGLNKYRQLLHQPFRIVYRVEGTIVFVVAILHQRQSIQKALQKRVLL